jgi:bis(5'-nucleosyl)-tetraphosphatase (symmetrical)
MTIYAVGDIQGCLQPLKRLLAKVNFDPDKDELWSTGDIVNRGPDSLQTLRFLHKLGESFKMVLGNHELHLLAIAAGVTNCKPQDTLQKILTAPDRNTLLKWLQSQPLLIRQHGYTMTHAGIPPTWSVKQASALASEVEQVLRGDSAQQYFDNMYGNTPKGWNENLEGPDRWRVITNCLTRMRYCDSEGDLELKCKKPPSDAPQDLIAWFSFPDRKAAQEPIIFGHWASLMGMHCQDNVYALDTACVWGGCLRFMELGSNRYIEISCDENK